MASLPNTGVLQSDANRYSPNGAAQRLLGAYYTPGSAADYMADWVIRHDGEHVLEPSFGDGIFLQAIETSAARRNFTAIHLTGIEIDEQARMQALHRRQIAPEDAYHQDFLSVSPFKVQAVIGNPPYVRLRHLTDDQRTSALYAAQLAMGKAMDPSGSLWMPFVLHAMQFLDIGGRLAFVLPYDFTYVKYAWPLWKELRENFGALHVLRTHQRLFPDLLQDVVILFADNYGSRTDTVRYQAFQRVEDLLNGRPIIDTVIQVDGVQRGERVFVSALLGDDLRDLLDARISNMTVPARKLVTFNIGYVTGDKTFFHPTDSVINEYQLPSRSLHPALTSARMLKGIGLRSSAIDAARMPRLFLPDPQALEEGEDHYIAMGMKWGVSRGYKCRNRDPWYVVPDTRVPDVVLSVFAERPVLLVNDAECFASNSLLCGFCKGPTSEELATGWYTSLTLLQCELEVHALGGGVMVMVPREAGNLRLPRHVDVRADHLSHLDQLLQHGRVTDAYQSGDLEVLQKQLGLSETDIDLVRNGIEILAYWRTSARSSL